MPVSHPSSSVKRRFVPALAAALPLLASSPAYAAPAANMPYAPGELGTLSSVATLQDASALSINPAALAFMRGSDLFLSRSVNGYDQTNLFLTGGGVGTAWQEYNAGGRFLNDFTFGGGTDLAYGFSVGGRISYLQFMDGLGGNCPNFGIGGMFRPNNWLSIGLMADNLTMPPAGPAGAQLSRSYRAGIGLHPFTDRVTLSADALYFERDPLGNIYPTFGAQAELLPMQMVCTYRK